MRALIVLAAAAALALAGCAPQGGGTVRISSPHASTSSPQSPAPTPTASPLPSDVLFQITVTATEANGAVATLVETVHAPVATTDHQPGDEAQLDNECDSWRNAFPNIQYVVANVTTTTRPGTAWDAKAGQVAVDMAGYPVWSGDQQPFQAFCASALPGIPGSARAVSPVGGDDPDRDGGWGIYRYGFGVPTDPSDGTPSPGAGGVVLSHCSIQLGSAAHDSVFASAWPTSAETDNGLSCFFGGSA